MLTTLGINPLILGSMKGKTQNLIPRLFAKHSSQNNRVIGLPPLWLNPMPLLSSAVPQGGSSSHTDALSSFKTHLDPAFSFQNMLEAEPGGY